MRRAGAAAAVVGLLAFALYRATLLPGLDLGDTGSFDAAAGSATITPRDGYPLYFAIGDTILWITRAEPARALNLASAIEGGIACGLLVLVASELSGSITAGIAAALLFAGSYTFWSQAIIAEVYALHALFIALTLFLLLRWQQQPGFGRLTLFFAAYALGFGNHLSMILLAPGYTLFLMIAGPKGWRTPFQPRVVAIAIVCAAAGALQYAWNLHALWHAASPPHGIADALRSFWFDVTKTDWRETMVMQVPSSTKGDRFAMYAFDLHQQFGWIGVLLAIAGLIHLFARTWRRALLLLMLYIVNVVFAFTYNVGDTHVFYIPSHLFVALLAAVGLVAIARLVPRRHAVVAVAAAGIAYAAVRIYADYPALDRSRDRRPIEVLAALTSGLDDRRAILLTDLNWQLENGLTYFAKQVRPEVAYTRMPEVLRYLPALVRDNVDGGREAALTERARAEAEAAYGPLFTITRDERVPTPTFAERIASLPDGTRYAVIVLKPTREQSIDSDDFVKAAAHLTHGAVARAPLRDYFAMAGLIGAAPDLVREESRPFRAGTIVAGTRVEVRIESWLAADTIRRMGFAQAIAGRHHTLIGERGVSFAAFAPDGLPILTAYAGSIYAPQPRYLIRPSRRIE